HRLISARPAAVGLGPLDLGRPGRVHPTGGAQALDPPDVALRPVAPRPAGREPLEIGRLVPAPVLPVDPSVGDGLLDRRLVGQARRPGRPLLGQYEPDAVRFAVMLAEPGPPARGALGAE